jgi:hypothetical protein
MGRPIKKKFIKSTQPHHITCTAWTTSGGSAKAGTIVRQKTSNRYKVTTADGTALCKLVTGTPTAAGQMSITVQPYVTPTVAAIFVVHMQADSATLGNAGTGYVATNTITLAGGTGTATVITVDTIGAGGSVATFHISTPGDYTALPTNPVAQGSTNGIGTGATFNLKYKVLSFSDTGNTGTGYGANTEIVFDGGGFTTQATGTVASGTGSLLTPTVTATGSGYTSIPTITALSFGITQYANKVNNRTVETFQDKKYKWELTGAELIGVAIPNGPTSQGTGTLGLALIQSS